MTDEQIAALARELADRLYSDNESYRKILWWCNEPKEEKARELEYTLRFLLEDYCIVEKSKLTEEYYEAKFTCGNVDPCSETFAASLAEKSLLERLFPELFKTEEK